MKHGLTYLLLLFCSLAAEAARPPMVAEQHATGFRIAKLPAGLHAMWLGMPRQQFRNLVPEQRLGAPSAISYFSRSDETLTLNGYRITGISYGFYKDQLCCIEVRVLGEANCRGIQALLAKVYGPGATASGQYWQNPQLRLQYSEMPKGYATLLLASPSLLAQFQAEQQPRNQAV
ncbi:hypothetical protein [Hymenobacter sp. BT190]|uniref:hypothetical protein n=1 Tax=Hymenobacter sp. BT190 TaxID=2763505 RepID=UPI00165128A6|nr:hypothetical protein [Hymenobacter sp. BT190]MBC6697608.1 hypothetical protein [Hymenobacter sp. BT190]